MPLLNLADSLGVIISIVLNILARAYRDICKEG